MNTTETFLHEIYIGTIYRLLIQNESVTLSWLPDGGKTYFAHQLQDKSFFEKIDTKKALDTTHFIIIDQSIGINYINEHISAYLSGHTEVKDVKSSMYLLINKGYKFVFIIDNFEYDKEFFMFINSLRSISLQSVQFVFLTLRSDYEKILKVHTNSSSLVFHNIIHVPYIPEGQVSTWVEKLVAESGIELSKGIIADIVRFSGGNPGLIRNIIRFFANYKTFSQIKHSREMKILVSKIWAKFTPTEQEILQQLAFKRYYSVDLNNVTVRQFMEHKLLAYTGKIRGEWIHYTLMNREGVDMYQENNQIFIGGVNTTEFFNTREQEFLILLMKYNNIVYRDELGEMLSEKNPSTDWRIDKFISRLRAKLVSFGLSPDIIKSVRGKGFKLILGSSDFST